MTADHYPERRHHRSPRRTGTYFWVPCRGRLREKVPAVEKIYELLKIILDVWMKRLYLYVRPGGGIFHVKSTWICIFKNITDSDFDQIWYVHIKKHDSNFASLKKLASNFASNFGTYIIKNLLLYVMEIFWGLVWSEIQMIKVCSKNRDPTIVKHCISLLLEWSF